MTPASLRQIILDKIPEEAVIPRHTDREHLYEVVPCGNKIFKSVTTRLQVLKDESLTNYKMNRAIDYIFANYRKINDQTVMEILDLASKQSGEILEDAGDIGRRIHEYREAYFDEWIKTGKRPESALAFVPEVEVDPRATSGMRGLEKFVLERDYIPVMTELKVWDEKFEVAGTLDDIGLIRKTIRPGKEGCAHEIIPGVDGKYRCVVCDLKYTYELCLLDLKTSNQFKDHYFFQVALYYMMFCKLSGLKPKRCFILKVSKEDGSYKIEELRQLSKLVKYAQHMLRTNDGLDFIRKVRKDNQRNVLVI